PASAGILASRPWRLSRCTFRFRPARGCSHRPLGEGPPILEHPPDRTRHSRGVERGAQLRLVVDTVEIQSAGEINEGFLFVEDTEFLDSGLQGCELAVRVEEIEFAGVLAEVADADILILSIDECFEDFLE